MTTPMQTYYRDKNNYRQMQNVTVNNCCLRVAELS